jgi:hypothetical protein
MHSIVSIHGGSPAALDPRPSRRRFLAAAAGALAVPYFVPGATLGLAGRAPASERIRTGHIGVGGQGSGHFGAMLGNPGTQVMAVCDPFQSKREARQRDAETSYAAQLGKGSYKGCAR